MQHTLQPCLVQVPWVNGTRADRGSLCHGTGTVSDSTFSVPPSMVWTEACALVAWQQTDRFDHHANVAGSQFTVCRSMAERHLSSIMPLKLLPPIVAITPSEWPKPRRWRSPHAYFSTSAQQRDSGSASMESTHMSDQGADVLESLGPSWAGLFRNRGLRGPAGKRRLG